ncbi:hypothetical protein [Bifidobacterium callitrichos]|uniref:Phage protein n=1 Tax=Bifidobacterium callitrichos DSM 23973 TaxID=1437609 RepID=A0A087ACU3_9BIFI|nr:hypothetical protein [Bifidobacterium callitrichos]KFI56593.1 hypothetical protein BCAL_0191 [Bifidobacterium callitrichos DSM 23973]
MPKSPLHPSPKTVTVHGVTLTIDPELFDDYEIVEDLYDVQSGENPLKAVPLLRRLLGDKYEEVKDALRGEDGRITSEALDTFLTDLMEAANPNS